MSPSSGAPRPAAPRRPASASRVSRRREPEPRRRPIAALLACALAAVGACHRPPAPDAGLAPPSAMPPASGASGAPAAGGFAWRLPAGFPEPLVPPGNPLTAAKVELGRHLFHDRRLSGNGTLSCAGCHRPELAFTDGRPRAVGSTGERHPRGAMSLANVAYSRTLTWADPKLRRLEDQMRVPMFGRHPVELGLAGRKAEVLARLRAEPRYRDLFARAFPGQADPFGFPQIVAAIASFERTLLSGNSPYDRLLWWDEEEAMSPAARRGMRLFFSPRLGCAACHAGFTFSGPVVYRGRREAEPVFHNTGLYNVGGRGQYPADNPGLRQHTGRRRDDGRFRAPTLRNIALTAPYMHDGSLATLAEVVAHYAAGGRTVTDGPSAGKGRANPYKSPRLAGFEIDAAGTADLIAFLESLTDQEFVRDPRFADPWAESVAAAR